MALFCWLRRKKPCRNARKECEKERERERERERQRVKER